MADQKEIDDGGSAFPLPVSLDLEGRESIAYPGMSLRDWFAGQFLVGAVAASNAPLDVKDPDDQSEVDAALRKFWDFSARASYIAADAMIAARKAGQ